MKRVNDIKEAANLILDNKTFIYPTDTLYGIGVNAQSEQNIEKIYEIKKREGRKPISIAVSDIAMIEKIAHNNSSLIEKLIPGPFTFLLSPKKTLPKVLYDTTNKIGVRVPNHPTLRKILKKTNTPITSTSANISGLKAAKKISDIDSEIIDQVDFILDIKPKPKGAGSVILDLTCDPIKVLRNELFDINELRKILGVPFET